IRAQARYRHHGCWEDAVKAFLLSTAGVLLFGGAIALLIVSYSNPALLFAASAACVSLGLKSRRDVLKDLALLIGGLLLLAGALALSGFSDFNPAPLFVGGGICTFLGLVTLMSRPGKGGPPVSEGDVENAIDLSRAQRHYYD